MNYTRLAFLSLISNVKRFIQILVFVLLLPVGAFCQGDAVEAFIKSVNASANMLPEKLLATRTVVVHSSNFTEKEYQTLQTEFQKMGVDAVAYFDADLFFAGKDVEAGLYDYLMQRDISNFLFAKKQGNQFEIAVTRFNKKTDWVDVNQPAWSDKSENLISLLRSLYRRAWGEQQKQNLLINDYPERDLPFSIFKGRRSEFFAIDLKVDKLAIPVVRFLRDTTSLMQVMQHYPLKFGLTEYNWTTQKLRQEGYLFELCYIYAKGRLARSLLGYEIKEGETAFVSLSFAEGKSQLRTHQADVYVYKFYVRHLPSGNIFLGTAWDADPDWKKALENHIMAFKTELKLN